MKYYGSPWKLCIGILISSFIESTKTEEHDFIESESIQQSFLGDPLSVLGMSLETNRCKPNQTYVWCLPYDYNQEKHPFTYHHLLNKTLPWDYDFRFVIEEISNINDKEQSMMIHMYFAVMWVEPRLEINLTAVEWDEERTGPKDEINESPETLKYLWYPELEIYGLETFGRQRVLKEMSGVRMGKNKTINYELGVRVTISCRMVFDDYPLDDHSCQFQVGSYYDTIETVTCRSFYIYDQERQRSLQHFIQIEDLPDHFAIVNLPSGSYASCGFQVRIQRKQMQFVVQVYLPSFMFVIVSWVSFLVKPEVVPGRMAMLVTLFLVLINIFNSVREGAPISSRLNAVDLYLVVCIFFVFAALLEYAAILLLLKKRRKPLMKLEQGMKNIPETGIDDIAARRELMKKPWHSPGEGGPERGRNYLIQSSQSPEDGGGVRTALLRHESPDGSGRSARSAIIQPIKKHVPVGLTERKQALVDNIDAWAMWISPPIFVLFNIVYWIYYRPWTNKLDSAYTLMDYVTKNE